jgi:hypothetical protein
MATKPSDIYAQMKAQYSPTGGYMSGVKSQLDRLGKQSMARGMSNLVSSGLASTTVAGGLANAFAEDVAAPRLAQAETDRIGRLTDIMGQEANYYANLPENRMLSTTTIAPSKLISSAFAQAPQGMTPAQQDYEQQMAAWRNRGMEGNSSAKTSSSLPTLNLGNDSDMAMPQSLRSAMPEQNWVTINGKKYTADASGNYNFPWSK